MRKWKLFGGIVVCAVVLLIVFGMVILFQRLMISGTRLMNELGGMSVGEEETTVFVTPEPTAFLTDADFDYDGPIVTIEPEELFSIPVEQTAEELAKENEKK